MGDLTGSWRSIGVIHSPHQTIAGTPIQPFKARGIRGTVEVFDEYLSALDDVEGFERIWLIYWFHLASPHRLKVQPYMDTELRGLFATRAPSRPNPIGLSAVRLIRIERNIIEVEDVDMLDGTPLLDIKPYVPAFDSYEHARHGWLERVNMESAEGKADRRFHDEG